MSRSHRSLARSSKRLLFLERLEPRHLLFGFFDDGTLALEAINPSGVVESAVPIHHNGVLINNTDYQVVEAFDNVPGTTDFPLTFVDLHANTFLRATYQTVDGQTGGTGALGTSFVASPSLRTADGIFHFIPTVTRGDVNTDGTERYESNLAAEFSGMAEVTSTRRFPDPVVGETTIDVDIHFEATADIPLVTDATFVGNDRFRVTTISSMFSSSTQFDANVIRYEDDQGVIQTISLTDDTPRGQHLLSAPDEIGSWVELIKTEGSTWFPTSPSVRVEILNGDGLQLGVQGFLDSSRRTSDDSLSVWLEIVDAADTIASGTSFDVSLRMTATPPVPLDFGDAADPVESLAGPLNNELGRYPTRIESDGARHIIDPSGPFLGNLPPDAETNAAHDSIEIVNASFDQLQVLATDPTAAVLDGGQFTIGLGETTIRDASSEIGPVFVPGWAAISGTDGTRGISRAESLFNPPLAADDYALFAQGPMGIAEQILGVAVQPNTIYSLTVEAGDQVFLDLDTLLLVGLFVDGVELVGGISEFIPAVDGAFSRFTRTYATGDGVPDGDLAIRLGSTSTFFRGQVYYNNVSLTARSDAADSDDRSGTDDEDGLVSLTGPRTGDATVLAGDPFAMIAQVSGAGFLNAFADFNRDGDWDDDGEQIASGVAFDTSTGSDQVEITGTVPADAIAGTSVLRLRASTIGGLGPAGLADDGEVEDHPFQIDDCLTIVSHSADEGVGSLRDAIECANGAPETQTIRFELPADDPGHVYYQDDGVTGSVAIENIAVTSEVEDVNIADIDPDWPHSWWTIAPQSALPLIDDTIVIDGYTQVGSSANTNPVGQGLNTVLRVEINGEQAGDAPSGLLQLRTDGSLVRGLVINRSVGPKIRLDNFSDAPDGNTVIAGNFIGPDVSGTRSLVAPPAQGAVLDHSGVSVRGSAGNAIGGTEAADRNLISGNTTNLAAGVQIQNLLATGNRVQGNLIGTDRSGTAAVPNAIGVNTGNDSIVGGADPAAANVISGNMGGVLMQGRRSIVRGNQIGTDVTGQLPLGNTGSGVGVSINSSDHQILENKIAHNKTGVLINSGATVGNGNLVSRNSIFSNGGGIDLFGGGEVNDVPPESDPPDQDVGPNTLQNYPLLTSVSTENGGTRIKGNLLSTPDSTFRIEFFANRQRLLGEFDTGAFSEGETFLGDVDIVTDGNGLATIDVSVDALPADQLFVTATATDITDDGSGPRNNTSQFSMVEPLGGCSFRVTSTGGFGLGTLGESITCANLAAGPNTITFAIPADDPGHLYYQDDGVAGEVTFANTTVTTEADDANIIDIDPDFPRSWNSIRPEEPLPPITEPVIIDGGGAANTIPAPGPLDTQIGIELNGCLAMQGNGLHFRVGSEGSRVQGMAINCWSENGILIDAFGSITVAGNFIGTDTSGFVDHGNGKDGVLIIEANSNVIGGTVPGDRNLISGNNKHGVEISSIKLVSSNNVQGNVIGPDRLLSRTIGNSNSGVAIINGFNNLVGGTTAGGGNSINGNGGAGIMLLLDPGEISERNAFLGNDIGPANSGLGIDLGGDGVTGNDLDDPATTSDVETDLDGGPNQQQNFPSLISATTNGTTEIVYSLQSLPLMDFRVEFFANNTLDPSGFGEGASYLGATNVRTDVLGNASTAAFASPLRVEAGRFITATATRLGSNGQMETSEFSAAVEVQSTASDYGDAPTAEQSGFDNSYPTRRDRDGARHAGGLGLFLGTDRDVESDGQPTAMADGDGADEDGVTVIVNPMAVVDTATTASFSVTASAAGKLDAWIDFNRNGSWLDANEQLFADSIDLVAGTNLVSYSVPAGASTGNTYARFRFSSAGGLPPDGPADDGEVEDYALTILDGNGGSSAVLDVAGSGTANPFQDGIIIVRFMLGQPDANLEDPALIPSGATRTTGPELSAHLDAAGDALDVNGDGDINPFQDGILIVRYLLEQPDANLEDPALIPAGSTRTTGAAIRAYLDTLVPPSGEGGFAQTDNALLGTTTALDALNVINSIGSAVPLIPLPQATGADVMSIDLLFSDRSEFTPAITSWELPGSRRVQNVLSVLGPQDDLIRQDREDELATLDRALADLLLEASISRPL